jgi:hypothetical protein
MDRVIRICFVILPVMLLVSTSCWKHESVTDNRLDVQEAVLRYLLKEAGLDKYHPMLRRIAPFPHSYCWIRLNPADPTGKFLNRLDDIQGQILLSNPNPSPRDSLDRWGHELVVDSVTWVNLAEATVYVDDRIHFKREFFHAFKKGAKWVVWQPTVIMEYDSNDPSRRRPRGLIM